MIARRALLAPLALLSGCSPASLLNTTVPSGGFRKIADIAYGDDPRQRLDLYLPETPDPARRVLTFFYGGAWTSGRKEDYLFVGQAMAAAGFLVAIPDYRLSPNPRFPGFVEDGARAMRWVQDNAAIHGGDATRLFMSGHSAGAHISLLLAVDTPYLRAAGFDRARLRGVIGIAGPYDFLPFSSNSVRDVFAGSDPAATQPINFVGRGLPPALLLHGDADETVFLRNSQRLGAAWQAAGNAAEVKVYRGVAHISIISAFSDLLRNRAPTLADTVSFLRGH
ncbi:MAG: alpha/beta hydrolase [Alphaproteobacteria bacterium]|nr:alpha/beta hydrolase [Alphaproteobacteria bacterium]